MSTADREDQVDKIIKAYNAMKLAHNEQAELEVRFLGVTKKIFMDTFAQFAETHGAPTIERTLVGSCASPYGKTTTQTKYNYIQDYTGDTPRKYFQTKTRTNVPVMFAGGRIEYKINLAREATVAAFPICNDAMIRFKVRASFVVAPWRYDFTAVRSGGFKEMRESMLSLREALMRGPGDAKVFTALDHTLVSGYEIEIEHVGGVLGKRVELRRADLAAIDKVLGVTATVHIAEKNYQQELYLAASAVLPAGQAERFKDPKFRQKRFASNVIGLTAATYYAAGEYGKPGIYPPWGFYATVKADGKRAILHSRPAGTSIIFSDKLETVDSPGAQAGSEMLADLNASVIVDAEVLDKTVLVFDVLYFAENISTEPFEARMKRIDDAVKILSPRMVGWTIRAKTYLSLGADAGSASRALLQLRDTPQDYPDDGLILVRPGAGYFNTMQYKWKPREQSTVDFLAKKCPASMLGRPPYIPREGQTLYWLFVGLNDRVRDTIGVRQLEGYGEIFPGVSQDYAPMQFSPAIAPYAYLWYHSDGSLDGSVVELGPGGAAIDGQLRDCIFDLIDWKFHRVRVDRKDERGYFGNDWLIAEMTVSSYWDPLPLSGLWQRPETYFMKGADSAARAGNKARRYVISAAIRGYFSDARVVVDIAAGQGADLTRYSDAGVKHLLAMDIDPAAIAELIRRRFSINSRGRIHKRSGNFSRGGMVVHALIGDLAKPPEETLANMCQFGITPGSVAGVACNFAIHYLCNTQENMRRVLSLASQLLSAGGIFFFTTMDGATVHSKLKGVGVGQAWELRDAPSAEAKYRIVRDYPEDILAPAGQMIKIKLPFTTELRAEPLCNIEHLLEVAKELGLVRVFSEHMDYLDAEFVRENPSLASKLSEADKQYTGLHRIVALKKK